MTHTAFSHLIILYIVVSITNFLLTHARTLSSLRIMTPNAPTPNTIRSSAFKRSMERYANDSNEVLRLYGLVAEDRMLREDHIRLEYHVREKGISAPEKSEYDDLLNRLNTMGHMRRAVDRRIEKARDAYNVAVCRRICNALYNKCPRELRDMVYAYVITKDVVDDSISVDASRLYGYSFRHVVPISSSQSKSCSERNLSKCSLANLFPRNQFDYCPPPHSAWRPTRPRPSTDVLCPEHFWRDEIVGTEVALELADSWYRHAEFNLGCPNGPNKIWTENFSQLVSTMAHDRFQHDFKPWQLIGNVTATVALGPARVAFGGGYEYTSKDLKQLFVLKEGARILLSITCRRFVMAHECRTGLEDFLVTAHPTLLKLQGKYRLHISLDPAVCLYISDRDEDFKKARDILRRFRERLDSEARKDAVMAL
jgi:hypothetical protein